MHRPNTLSSTQGFTKVKRTLRGASYLLVVVVVATTFVRLNTAGSSAFFEQPQDAIQNEQTVVGSGNSQTVALLQAVRNSDLQSAQGGGDIIVTDGVALRSDLSPFESVVREQENPVFSEQISLYQVQVGDTLSQVASMFNVSVSTIIWSNDLSSSKDIHPGQTLLILPVSGVQHTVRKGDTVRSLANTYSGDMAEIIAYNDLPSEGLLAVGSTITIPGGEVPVPQAPRAKKGTKASAQVSVSKQGTSGYFIHPVPGSVRTQGIHGYNGIDFGAPAGTPIRASAGGTVIVARASGWNGGYGNYVVIDHPNGTQTLYAHTSKNAVVQGQKVSQGEVVGYVGNTGRSTGNHLHFEVRGATNPF
jgi:LysM repeat protein